MNRSQIELYLKELGLELEAQGAHGDIVLAGGAVMLLLIENRDTTKDIDAYINGDVTAVRQAIEKIAQKHNLSNEWLNDGVKKFFYGTPPQEKWAEYPGLRIYTVSPEYLLAMKAVAGRPQDNDDLKALLNFLGITSPEVALNIIERYIPERLLTPHVRYFIEALF